jgi:hypothetical protein
LRGRARCAKTLYKPPRETLAATSSWWNSEALAMGVVLAHPCGVFHSYTCRLHRGAAAVAAALISYDIVEIAAWMTTKMG